ncbi:MAG: hypothetical protein RR202_04015 [Bacteroidales bacterium]
MKTSDIIRKIITILYGFFILIAPLQAATAEQETRKKELHQNFKVGTADLFKADNRYGNITIGYWDKNQVDVVVVIEAKAKKGDIAQELVDRVHIEFKQQNGTVSVVTSLENRMNMKGNNMTFSVNYKVTLPAKLNASLQQKYGNIYMPAENLGKYKLEAKYGDIEAGNFVQPLTVESAYGRVALQNLVKLELNGSYSPDIDIKSVENAFLNCKYSSTTIDQVNNIEMDDSYGSVTIGKLNTGSFEMKYGSIQITDLVKSFVADEFDYSKLRIRNIAPSFEKINMETRYSNVTLSLPKTAAFNVKAENMKYGQSRIESEFKITDDVKEDGNYLRATVNGGGKGNIYFDGGNYSNMKIKAL